MSEIQLILTYTRKHKIGMTKKQRLLSLIFRYEPVIIAEGNGALGDCFRIEWERKGLR